VSIEGGCIDAVGCDSILPCSTTSSPTADLPLLCSCARAIARASGSISGTIANLGQLPPALIDGLRVLLKGGGVVSQSGDAVEILRSLPHGHVAAVIAVMRKLDIPRLLGRRALCGMAPA
jgi:hypothetical protein